MKRLMIIILLLVMPPASANAFDVWDKQDKILFALSTASMAVDWRQTKVIAENPTQFQETNPLLGKHPSASDVDVYFAAAFVGTTVIAHILPSKYRKVWLLGLMTVSVVCIANNIRIGVGVQW